MTTPTPQPTEPQPAAPGEASQQEGPQTSAADLWASAYQQKPAPAEQEQPADQDQDNDQEASGLELLKRAYKPTPDATEGLLPADALLETPRELWEPVIDVYSQINDVFQESGIHVTREDPEWRIVQVELENPLSSLTRTLIAAEKAAEKKKARESSKSSNDLWGQAFKK